LEVPELPEPAGWLVIAITAEVSLVTLLKVAFTNTVTVPAWGPAVNVTEAPVAELRAPSELVSAQAYTVPEGQALVQVGVAEIETD
jgi:multidrug transporter EmrE-like cation transporter